ncbi:FadD32-like long-chain-fatty-acid--AMP ligase [Corynebacterium sp. H128]|uniref:FadD32-like long-chain-fatty-acid--AMP ligase n=1 Tax=unclassified Corynebacterium TaxID=2624378 RepID=UPI0030A99A94
MDLNAAMGRFFNDKGDIVLPNEFTLAAMCELMYQADAAAGGGDREVIRFWDYSESREGKVVRFTRSQVNTRIKAVAARLQQTGPMGSRVAILAGNSAEYIFAFLGALYAGMIPVPLYDPNEPGHTDHLTAVLADAKPNFALTNSVSAGAVRRQFAALPAAERPRILSVDSLPDSLAESFVNPMTNPEVLAKLKESKTAPADSIAFLQYTSGSTRTPAGVVLSNRNIMVNVLQIFRAAQLKHPMRLSLWIPLHHDMGMILAAFVTILGVELDLMRPKDFLQQPTRWLEQLNRRENDHNVYTVVPNFALDLACRYGKPEGAALDLSAVDGIINGSEPVTQKSVEAFFAEFGQHGLKREAMRPTYGLAEATLLVSTPSTPNRPLFKSFDREELAQGRVTVVEDGSENASVFASVGEPIAPMCMALVDPETREELPEGQIGEFWVYGENNAIGYLDRDEETVATFRNTLVGRLAENSRAEGVPADAYWMATGDLGTFIDGQIYLTSRLKDLIVIAGRNHYPQDIEHTVQVASDHIRPGAVAAFAIEGEDVEKLVIIAERDLNAEESGDAAAIAAIKNAVTENHGINPHDVRIVAPEDIKRSSSGKIARRVVRKFYLEGN